jgi:hypothetical protein
MERDHLLPLPVASSSPVEREEHRLPEHAAMTPEGSACSEAIDFAPEAAANAVGRVQRHVEETVVRARRLEVKQDVLIRK